MQGRQADLTEQQQAFVREYMRDLNGEEAALRLGHGRDDARQAAARLLREPDVTRAIGEELGRRARRTASLSRLMRQIVRRERPFRAGLLRAAQIAAARWGLAIEVLPQNMRGEGKLGPENEDAGVLRAYWHGRCFYCFGDGPISQSILHGKEWDPHLKRIIHQVCKRKPNGTVVEVGANIGATFLTECATHPDVRFVLIEPINRFFKLLEMNAESFECMNTELHNVAISDRRGDVVLLYDQTSGGVASEASFTGMQHTAVVETVTLDEMFPEENITLLKADVDGYELDVFRGGANLIRRSRPDILFEFNPVAIEVRGFMPSELPETLAGLGVGVFDIYSSGGEFIETTRDPARLWVVFRSLMNPLTHLDIHARGEDSPSR